MAISTTVTMKQIAAAAGVSRPLVSQILNGKYPNIRVGEETKAKVKSVAEQMGYIPNSAAKAIVTGRFNCISLLQSSTDPARSMLPLELLQGIQEKLNGNGMHLVLSALADEKLTSEGFVPKILSELYVDGLLVNYNANIPEAMKTLINDHRIPSIWINSKQETDCICPNDYNGGLIATEHLLELGHKRIAFVSYAPEVHYSVTDRKNGYLKAMEQAGLQAQVSIVAGDTARAVIGKLSREILAEDDAPTAIVGYADNVFQGMIRASFELNLSLGEDLSLVTFNAGQSSQFTDIVATSVLLPEQKIGERATEMLIDKINNPGKEFAPEKLSCKLEMGNTTSKPNAKALA